MVQDKNIFLVVNTGSNKELRDKLEAGGNPNAFSGVPHGPDFSVLEGCLERNKIEKADLLLAYGADVRDTINTMPNVCWLAEHGRVDALKMLLDYEPNIYEMAIHFKYLGNDEGFETAHRSAWQEAQKNGHTEIVTLLDRHDAYLKLEHFEETLTKEILCERKNKYGDGLLDNPATWRQLPKVLEQLEARGERLTLEDMMQCSRDGRSWMQRAVECNQGELLLSHLNQAGERLGAAQLLNETGQPNALLEKIFAKQKIGLIFQYENWKGADRHELSRLHDALPEEEQADIGNFQQLRTALQRENQREARTRA